MEAENNSVFIKNVMGWMGGASFAELNERLPDVADAIYRHDTTGMAEPFQTIEERLKMAFGEMAQRHVMPISLSEYSAFDGMRNRELIRPVSALNYT